MNLKCFGIPDPAIDADPKLARSNTLQFYKNSILLFMPNQLITWNSIKMDGNPNKSLEVNGLIKQVKNQKSSFNGKKSIDQRGIQYDTENVQKAEPSNKTFGHDLEIWDDSTFKSLVSFNYKDLQYNPGNY
jgi:hypothetical protein